jgi:hypothetical protein
MGWFNRRRPIDGGRAASPLDIAGGGDPFRQPSEGEGNGHDEHGRASHNSRGNRTDRSGHLLNLARALASMPAL